MSLPVVLTLGLLILPVLWFITDPRSFQERIKQYLTLTTYGALVIELGFVYFNFVYSNTLPFTNTTIAFIGVILYLLGLFISIWAKITMGKFWGRPAQHNIKRQNKLINIGPFKYSRNPIYLGLILAFLGYSLVLKSIFIILNIFVILYFYRAALKEEKILEKHFGKRYLRYKSLIPRFL